MGGQSAIDELLQRIRGRARTKGPTLNYPQNYIDELERELAERLRVNLGLMTENRTLKEENRKFRAVPNPWTRRTCERRGVATLREQAVRV